MSDDICNSLKVILVGEGGAGKSTLAKNLMHALRLRSSTSPENIAGGCRNPSPDWDGDCSAETVGIDIHECITKNKNNTDICIKIWDFAGQRLYHSAHEVSSIPYPVCIIPVFLFSMIP